MASAPTPVTAPLAAELPNLSGRGAMGFSLAQLLSELPDFAYLTASSLIMPSAI
jgi:hypothetical protein